MSLQVLPKEPKVAHTALKDPFKEHLGVSYLSLPSTLPLPPLKDSFLIQTALGCLCSVLGRALRASQLCGGDGKSGLTGTFRATHTHMYVHVYVYMYK